MSLDSTPADKRKSLLIATLIYAVLLLIMFFIRFWPPSDAELALLAGGGGGGGVTVNFGDTDFGSGADFQSKELDVKEVSKNNESQPTPDEDIAAGLQVLGPILKRFTSVSTTYQPVADGSADKCYISSSFDATSHFESDCDDLMSLYERVSGEKLDMNINPDAVGDDY